MTKPQTDTQAMYLHKQNNKLLYLQENLELSFKDSFNTQTDLQWHMAGTHAPLNVDILSILVSLVISREKSQNNSRY